MAAAGSVSYWRYLHCAAYSTRITIRSINQTSGIQNLDQQRYFDETAPFPPYAEQTAIAAFVDRETAKIDRLVAEQERLIALLKEKRQAVVSHAVTKGLDPNAPMKDSGVEWLGAVPAHWNMKRLKRVSPQITVGIVVNPSRHVFQSRPLPRWHTNSVAELSVSRKRTVSNAGCSSAIPTREILRRATGR